MSEATDAAEVMARAKDQVTLDEFMRRNPKTMTDDDYRELIAIQRRDRARFMVDDQEKKAKKHSK